MERSDYKMKRKRKRGRKSYINLSHAEDITGKKRPSTGTRGRTKGKKADLFAEEEKKDYLIGQEENTIPETDAGIVDSGLNVENEDVVSPQDKEENKFAVIHEARMEKKRRRKTKAIILSVAISVFAVIIVLGSVLWSVVSGILTGYDGKDGEYEMVDEIAEAEKGTGKMTFVIAGVDKVAGITDTIMVGCYDFDNDVVNIISIPRDTRMYIANKYQKINSAYAIKKNGVKKGMNGTIEAIKRLTGVPEINHYIEFNTQAFRDTIDALDGVDFNVPRNMFYEDPEQGLYINLKKGEQHLDGKKAEQLVRFRGYPMGDIDRVKVQQDFVKAVAEQKLNVGIIEKVPELFGVVGESLRTDLEMSDIVKYTYNLADLKPENIHLHNLPGWPNDTDYGASYWIADINGIKALMKETFGCDSTGATIHSADGSSALMDTKKTPTPSPEVSESPKPSTSPKPTATSKPTVSPKPASTSKPTASPKVTASPTLSPKPTKSPEATKTPAPTKKPEVTKSPGGIKRPSAN